MDLKDLQKSWDAWGKHDPLFAILSFPDKKNNRWEVDEFFQSGQQEIDQVLASLDQLSVPVRKKSALDFGCGAGRLTQALCRHFESASGVDIAPSMIELARQYNRAGARCHYFLNEGDSLCQFADGSFDFVYSCRVLQHIAPRFSKTYIRELYRILAPGGVLVFQHPSERLSPPLLSGEPQQTSTPIKQQLKTCLPKWLYNFYWLLKGAWLKFKASRQLSMEMYYIAEQEIVDLMAELGAKLVDVKEDDSVPDGVSLRYTVIKEQS